MRVRRQTAVGEIDAPAIEGLAAGRGRDEHRRATVLGDPDRRGSLRLPSRHVSLPGAADAVAQVRPDNAKAKLPGPPARTLKRGKPGWRPRSASADGSAKTIYDVPFSISPFCFLTES